MRSTKGRVGQGGAWGPGRNLIVQPGWTELVHCPRAVQAGGGAAPDRLGDGALGDHLLQPLPQQIPAVEQAIETAGAMLGRTNPVVTA